MLKHSEIIENLGQLEKIAAVTGDLGEGMPAEVCPAVGKASLEEISARAGVSYACAARSWDGELLGKMTEELVAEAAEGGARLFVTPDLKVAIDPARAGLTEDPFLNGVYGAAMCGAVKNAGGAVALSRLSLDGRDVSFLDLREDRAAVHRLVTEPFRRAAEHAPCDAVVLCPNRVGSGYPDSNRILLRDAQDGYFGEDVFVIGEDVAPNAEALRLLKGKIVLGGAKLPLERGSRRYRDLVKYRDEGSISVRDVEEAARSGSALSDETLDGAVDEVIDFCERVSALTPVSPIGDEARRKIAAESIVLLRNDGTLPLAKGKKVAVIGDAYDDLSALGERFKVVGAVQGYERETDRSDALIPEAVRMAGEADAAIVFLSPLGDSLTLPANRIALLDALSRTGKPVIALVCGDVTFSMDFDKSLSATLVVPADGPFAGEALAQILSGEISPSGKLVRTAYDDAEGYFAFLKEERDAGRLRVGPFLGYSRYDTADEYVRYPFGFGLSYGLFVYSKLTVNGDTISFNLKNKGGYDGTEVVEIYLGVPAGTHVVPKKQLVAAKRVFLRAGESRTVSVDLPEACYKTFDSRVFGENVEAGTYQIYVCASATDVRLRGKRVMQGVKREPVPEIGADYFPGHDHESVANVRAEARVKGQDPAPKPLRIAKRAARLLLPILAIAFFLIMTMFILSYAVDFALFRILSREMAMWILSAIAIVVVAVVPLLGSLSRKRLARIKAAAVTISPILLLGLLALSFLMVNSVTDEEFNDFAFILMTGVTVGTILLAIVAAVVDAELKKQQYSEDRWAKFYYVPEVKQTVTPDREFEEAFRAAEREEKRTPAGEKPKPQLPPAPVFEQFYDKSLTYEAMARDLQQFLSERGIAAGGDAVRDYIGAISSTQLLILPQGNGAKLVEGVAEYFGRKAYIDNAEGVIHAEDLFTHWNNAERRQISTGFSRAIEDAKENMAFLHTVLIRHVDAKTLAETVGPVADALARRTASLYIEGVIDEILPPNILIAVETEQETLEGIPAEIAEVAAVLTPDVSVGEELPKKTVFRSVGFERISALKGAVRDEFPLSENAWKSVDKLDEDCKAVHIGNLLWVRLERHASAVLACGGSEGEAVKSAVDTEVCPWLRAVWDDEICGGKLDDALREINAAAAPAKTKTTGRKAK